MGLERVSPSIRSGAAAYASYGLFLAVEAWWIAVGPRWFEDARAWAELHAFSAVGPATGAILFLALAWAITRGYRWAWYVAVISSGLLLVGAVGMLLTLTPGFPQLGPWPPEGTRGPALFAGVVSLVCLSTGVFSLCRKEARNWITEQQEARHSKRSRSTT